MRTLTILVLTGAAATACAQHSFSFSYAASIDAQGDPSNEIIFSPRSGGFVLQDFYFTSATVTAIEFSGTLARDARIQITNLQLPGLRATADVFPFTFASSTSLGAPVVVSGGDFTGVTIPNESVWLFEFYEASQNGPENTVEQFWSNLNFQARATNPVPEPATMAVLGLGAAALLRRRRSAK